MSHLCVHIPPFVVCAYDLIECAYRRLHIYIYNTKAVQERLNTINGYAVVTRLFINLDSILKLIVRIHLQ